MITIRGMLRSIGVIFLLLAASLFALTIVTWPPGGLFFALPFFFLFPAIFFGIAAGVLLLLTYRPKGLPPERRERPCRAKKSGYT